MTSEQTSQPVSAPQDAATAVAALEAENKRLKAELADRAAAGLDAPDWPDHVWAAIGYSKDEYRRNHPDNAPPAVDSATGTATAAPPV